MYGCQSYHLSETITHTMNVCAEKLSWTERPGSVGWAEQQSREGAGKAVALGRGLRARGPPGLRAAWEAAHSQGPCSPSQEPGSWGRWLACALSSDPRCWPRMGASPCPTMGQSAQIKPGAGEATVDQREGSQHMCEQCGQACFPGGRPSHTPAV